VRFLTDRGQDKNRQRFCPFRPTPVAQKICRLSMAADPSTVGVDSEPL
jgi:hypothetical protein